MKAIRGLVAVIGGLAVTRILVQPLEITLVNAFAGQPLRSAADFAAVLNTPGMMAARLFYTCVAAILGGYVAARIAAHDPMRYTAVAAAFQAIVLTWGFAAGYALPTPLWMRIALVVVSTLGMLAGGGVRAAVAALPGATRKEQHLAGDHS
jgi:hypothetical protein